MNHHKYELPQFSVLKLASLYGANAAGKSNLIKSIGYLHDIVQDEALPINLAELEFRFKDGESEGVLLGAEFSINQVNLCYAIEILDNRISTEELIKTSVKPNEDSLVFRRTTSAEGRTQLEFPISLSGNERTKLLKEVIEVNLSTPEKPVLKLLGKLREEKFAEIGYAVDWFENKLQLISPSGKPLGLAQRIDSDAGFKSYAQNILSSFNVGIKALKVKKTPVMDFFGEENKDEGLAVIKTLKESKDQIIIWKTSRGEFIDIMKEQDNFYVKQIRFLHDGSQEDPVEFKMDEESDGTIRLLDFIPAFKDLINTDKVFIIDEIERSVHPLLIKELVRKYSEDSNTKGQLIFTTHESNLLDQDIFRQDEIWFAEKTPSGSTELYSLSDFKEHNTIDIRKGYLNGRYGSIPFLGNLTDLNWH
jgi:AAA15 family ATPase/GTPase